MSSCHDRPRLDTTKFPYCSTTDFKGDNGWKVRKAFTLATDTAAIAGIYGTMGLDRSIYHPDQQGPPPRMSRRTLMTPRRPRS